MDGDDEGRATQRGEKVTAKTLLSIELRPHNRENSDRGKTKATLPATLGFRSEATLETKQNTT